MLWGRARLLVARPSFESQRQAQRKIDTFSPGDIAKFSWGLVKVKFVCWPLQKRFVKLCMSRLGSLTGESCAYALVPVADR